MLFWNDLILGGKIDISRLTRAPLRLAKATWLQTSQNDLFALISDHEQLAGLFPGIQKVLVDNRDASVPGGLGARRCCYFGNDLVVEEVIVGWDPPRFYAYQGLEADHPFGLSGHIGLVTCEVEKPGTILTWRHYFDHANPQAMQEKMACNLRLAFDKLIKRFEGRLLETYQNFR